MTDSTKNYIYNSYEIAPEKTSVREVALIVIFSTVASVSAIFGLFMCLQF